MRGVGAFWEPASDRKQGVEGELVDGEVLKDDALDRVGVVARAVACGISSAPRSKATMSCTSSAARSVASASCKQYPMASMSCISSTIQSMASVRSITDNSIRSGGAGGSNAAKTRSQVAVAAGGINTSRDNICGRFWVLGKAGRRQLSRDSRFNRVWPMARSHCLRRRARLAREALPAALQGSPHCGTRATSIEVGGVEGGGSVVAGGEELEDLGRAGILAPAGHHRLLSRTERRRGGAR